MAGEISLDRLRIFLEVYRAGSLSRAARSLGISQPSATAHISALEHELDATLFIRTAKGATATARADSLASEVADHLDALETVLWNAAEVTDLPTARRVIHLAGPAEYLSIRVLPRLSEWLPGNTTVRTRFGIAEPLLAELAQGIHDMVISSVPAHRVGLQSMPLFDEEFSLVASPAFASAWRDDERFSAGDPVIAYAESLPIIRRWWHTVWGFAPRDLNLIATVPDLRTVADMAVAGIGISVLPTYLVQQQLAEGSLVELMVPEMRPLNTIFLVTRAGERSRNPLLAQVIENLRALES